MDQRHVKFLVQEGCTGSWSSKHEKLLDQETKTVTCEVTGPDGLFGNERAEQEQYSEGSSLSYREHSGRFQNDDIP
ncbi:hypothetical protein RHMOL_Rhmol10G0129200 [Rhododendron molle]|uniref:Uncharacterized protein n=1 Tax=Rhododendron molle TaxID=49168 RepID=A0ACC0M2N0_RHOML|nr:hypothetical protein RHMOL_Rhmol10G0129200 [Rhododendron molle]